ncbi:MAG: carbamoyltransferase C-terminal domain-containing protein [Candidatus Curtissbacteria bacterium]|nr:carbamoyltransferase C-terminal domain-containing protein [Candidatus Curtissbacteria bacterium]
MIVLGVNEAHNSSAVLAIDGKIVAAAQEERFVRVKNQFGIPYNAIKFCLDFAKISPENIDLVVFSGGIPQFITTYKKSSTQSNGTVLNLLKLGKYSYIYFMKTLMELEYRFHSLRGVHNFTLEKYYRLTQKIFFPKTAKILEKKIGIPANRHLYLDHHTAHTYAALYSSPFPSQNKDALIITCDGGGDGISSTVSTCIKGKVKRIALTNQDNSLGCLYGVITDVMGMDPLEHEYKVMGLAPYAEEQGTKRIYDFLKTVISFDETTLSFKTVVSSDNLNRYVRRHLPRYRFDHLAGAIQRLTEELICDLVQTAIEKTSITNILFGGGVAQNVKVNQKIAALPKVKGFFAMPSGGDESNAIGAAYWGCRKMDKETKLQPLQDLYLGPSFDSIEIKKAIAQSHLGKKYQVKTLKNPNLTVAQLLVRGEIVARLSGRMEFGARALGNRSILADPSLSRAVKIINRSIKSRDFWMPFAPSILDTQSPKYLQNPKNLNAPFMTITFDIRQNTRQDFLAAIHPFDNTSRAQIVTVSQNPQYYDLLKDFKKITGRGAILNTSFNIHGEPIVCSPQDAISTLKRSGLKYLVMESYLIEKL